MIRLAGCLVLLMVAVAAQEAAEPPASASSVASEISDISLDPAQCYRVRDLPLVREDLKIYLNDGYLMLAKPVRGKTVAAVFTSEVENGDAELLLMVPSRSERASIARFTKTPNLNEHFRAAVFIFTDDTGEELRRLTSELKPMPELGAALGPTWEPVTRNLARSFGIRLVQDIFDKTPSQDGFFFGAISGRDLGNFDLMFEPRARDQILVGQVVDRDNRTFFDVWTSFRARSWRAGRRKSESTRAKLSDFQIDVTLDSNLRVLASTKVKLVPATSTRMIAFDLSRRMSIKRATINGKPAECFSRDALRSSLIRATDNNYFLLVNEVPFEPGKSYDLTFEHEGDVVSPAGNGVFFVGARGDWYPNRAGDFANYDLTFRHPKDLKLVSVGEVVDDRIEGESRIVRLKTSSPIRFAGFNLGDYEKASGSAPGISVDVYANRKLETALQPRRPEMVVPQMPSMRNRRPPDLQPQLPMTMLPDPKTRLRELVTEISGAAGYF
ncbi:MAG TPA: hypothetical protein VE621_06890, partial [Bryobacteraceae bacterium]|nr:hypothetical protein [Bryobacteraceae bacterium]